jgi:osomolarity two-component system, response regulator SKN7
MPKLDGISATNLIRKFDSGTPIISMTVNSKPNEIMEYYSSGTFFLFVRFVRKIHHSLLSLGMNDILPKPFTKEGLLDMLEVSINFIFFSYLFYIFILETSYAS